jgi:hypothetical protein
VAAKAFERLPMERLLLGGIISAGVRVKVSWVVDHDVRRAPLVWGISLLDRTKVQAFDQDVTIRTTNEGKEGSDRWRRCDGATSERKRR